MDFLDDTKEFKLIVTDNKNEVIKYISSKKKLINYKVMSVKEFRKKYYFDYDLKTVYYLMEKYNFKYDICKTYLDNMIYLTKDTYKHKKLSFLNDLKNELISNDLLIFDPLFKKYLEGKRIYVVTRTLDKFDEKMFNTVSKNSNVTYHTLLNPTYEHKVIPFETMDNEVEYVAYKISELYNEGISLNKIKLTNVSDDYVNTINRVFSFYNLKADLKGKTSLYSTYIYKKFIENLDSTYEVSLESIDEYKDTQVYKEIVSLINKVYFIKPNKYLLNEEAKNTYLSNAKETNTIEIVDYKTYYFKEDEYVFMLGFNNGSIPVTIKDEAYLTDNLTDELDIDTVIEKNIKSKKVTIDIIKSIKNLTITYKKFSSFDSFYPSTLVSEFGEVEDTININKSYSDLADKVRLMDDLDNLVKYGVSSNELSILNSNYTIPYNTYDHKYKRLDKDLLKEYLNGKLKLSYTSMDNYNKCAFKYYVSNVLKLDIYEETFNAFIGTLYHDVLQKCLITDKDVRKEIEEFINSSNRVLSKKEMFYIKNLTVELENALKAIKKSLSYTTLDKFMFEKRVEVIKTRSLKVTFTGFIDKIMYKEEPDRVIMVLIDYKTYKTDITLDYLEEGLYVQLPVYLFLARNLNIENVVFGGFYLHQVLNSSINPDPNSFKLVGYSNKDTEILKMVDSSYTNSEIIKSLRVKNDGDFYSYSKVLTNEEIDEVINKTDNLIDRTIDSISEAKFDINPKYTNKNVGCEYCKFRDICFMDETDINYIKKEVKGGSIDA